MLPFNIMDKVHLATFLMKLAPLSMCGFITTLVAKRDEEFSGYLGDNFPAFGSWFKKRLKRK